jgi:hypothetical protein
VSGNVDERLLGHWLVSRRRQEALRERLSASSLSVADFESWALDLIAEAVSDPQASTTTSAKRWQS